MKVIQQQKTEQQKKENLLDEKSSQYLSFIVGNEEFSVNILQVQEIRAWEEPTYLPNSPSYIKGVLNLRGTIVPVMDLRKRFNFSKYLYNATTVIIILKNRANAKDYLMGCVVDAVSDVFNFDEDNVKDVPDYASGIDSEFTLGIMTLNQHPITYLNLEKLLSLDLINHPYTGGKLIND